MRSTTLALPFVFLVGYAAQKYLATAPPIFVPAYLRTVLFIVAISAIAPLLVAWAVGRMIVAFPAFAFITLALTLGGSALAFAGYWFFVVQAYPNAPPVLDLARRGIAPGLFIGAILILDRWLSDRVRATGQVSAAPS